MIDGATGGGGGVVVDGEVEVLWRKEAEVIRDAGSAFDCDEVCETDGEE